MAITAEQQNSRLEGPNLQRKIVLQAPPELEPSDGVNTLLTSLVPLLGTASAMVMMLMTNSGLTGMLTGGMFMVSSLGIRGGQRLPPTFATHGEPRGGKT